MKLNYRHNLFQRLRNELMQIRPTERRLSLAAQAEDLLAELKPDRTYSYDFYFSRIMDQRPKSSCDVPIDACKAEHDIRLLIEDISDSACLSAESMHERVFSVEELSQRFNVSRKTITRWKENGLVGRRFVIDGRKRLGFLESSVNRFVAANSPRVRRGQQFSHLTEQEKDTIVQLARDLASTGDCPTEIIKKVALRVDRSIETVRYTMKRFDQDHPEQAVLAQVRGRLTEEEKGKIYTEFRDGMTVQALAQRYGRNPTYVRRLIRDRRRERIANLPLEFMTSPDFDASEACQQILAPMPQSTISRRRTKSPQGVPAYLAGLYDVPLLTREQEVHLFRKYNYLKSRASKLREQLAETRHASPLLDEIEQLYDQAVDTKNHLVQANLRLVVSIAKHYVGQAEFQDLVSDGNMSLIRAVERFDYSRGNKFSTYATWAIRKNFARSFVTQVRHRDRFRTSQDERLAAEVELRPDPKVQQREQVSREIQVDRILRCLDQRERQIVSSRFGLARGHEAKTLREVGVELGVSKERVRQIESRAIQKLRQAIKRQPMESPAA